MSYGNILGQHYTTYKDNNKGFVRVTYHQTDVVKTTSKTITLDTGGYFTATTKKRMNQASLMWGLGYTVYAKAGKWFVDYLDTKLEFKGKKLTFNR